MVVWKERVRRMRMVLAVEVILMGKMRFERLVRCQRFVSGWWKGEGRGRNVRPDLRL